MKNTYKYFVLLAIMSSINLFSQTLQGNPSKITTSSPHYDLFFNFEGVGFDSGTKKIMRLSNSLSKESRTEGFFLKDSEVVIGKDGMYQISVSGNVTEKEDVEQKEEYIIYIDGIEAFRGYETPGAPTGVLFFKSKLKKGDVLSIGTTMNDEEVKKSRGTNMLSIQLIQN